MPFVARALALLAFTCAAAPLGAQAPGAAAWGDSAAARVGEFVLAWRAAWQASEKARHPTVDGEGQPPLHGGDVRLQRLHCHGGWPWPAIAGAERLHVCPWWMPPGAPPAGDEGRAQDDALVPAQRDSVRLLRARLLDTLARLEARVPDVPSIAAQRLRFLVDQGDTSAARASVRACRDLAWRCMLLDAWLDHRAGDEAGAERRFDAALAAMPPDERCRHADVAPLLDDARERGRLTSLPCDARLAAARRVWWLADPLWSEPGNPRRVAQLAREVTVALRAEVPQDDRMHWDPRLGGDAMRELVLRYGWPTYFWWAGAFQDQDHLEWARAPEQRWGVPEKATFWAAEYAPAGRIHLVPDERQRRLPLDSAAWAEARLVPSVRPGAPRWWPREHWLPSEPVAPLADVQVAPLRRAREARLVVATDGGALTEGRILLADADTVLAALVLGVDPDTTVTIASARQAANAAVRLDGAAARAGLAFLSLELRPAHAAGDGLPRAPRRRARLVVRVPPALDALAAGERAVSPPVLLAAPPEGTALPEGEAALAGMLGGTTLARGARIGVYWEGYGFGAADTVRLTMRLVRHRDGALARIGRALRVPGLRAESDGAASVRWVEVPRAPGRVRTWARTLDLRALPAGRYTLEVSAESAGAPAATGRRALRLGG